MTTLPHALLLALYRDGTSSERAAARAELDRRRMRPVTRAVVRMRVAREFVGVDRKTAAAGGGR